MKNKYFLLLIFLCLLLVTPVLVSALNFDNLKGNLIIDETTSKYGKLTIYNWNFIGKLFDIKLTELELKKNTDICGTECSMETDIAMYKEGVLVDDVKFVGGEVYDYQFYYNTGGTRWLVEDYYNDCKPITFKNGTSGFNCSQVKYGSHWENNYVYSEYELGTIVPIGNYTIKLEGTKDFYTATDWQITSQGKLIDEWADWGVGGTITTVDGETVHTFLTSGYFNVSAETRDVKILVVAGGGGGGGANPGGGGGAGGLIYDASFTVAPGNHQVIVGAAQANSSFMTLNAKGGGVGADAGGSPGAGGSGGGAMSSDVSHDEVGAAGFATQGNKGGDAGGLAGAYTTGGGGGAGEEGQTTANVADQAGDGGDGLQYDINGTMLYYAGGGGGGGYPSNVSSGGLGGGGAGGAQTVGVAGLANTGGGGGGGSSGGGGGTGIVIIRYSNATLDSEVVTTLNSPIDYFNSTTNSITFNCSANTTSLNGEIMSNITLWLNTTGTWILNETKDVSGIYNNSIFTKNINDGFNMEWTCRAFDNASSFDWGTNRTFTIDTLPPRIVINSPSIISDYGFIGFEETLNWTIIHPIGIIDELWFSYNGTNTSVFGLENATTFILANPTYNLTFYANDSVGNQNSTFINWSYKFFLLDEIFNSTVLETSNQNFVLNADILEGFSIQKASLIYDNTTFTDAIVSGSGNNFNISKSITIPQGVQGFSSENRTFIFNITMVNDITGSTSSFLIAENNQTVNELSFGLCNVNLTIHMLNFTYKDELDGLEINASKNSTTFQATFQLGIDEDNLIKNLSINEISTNVSRFNFCTDNSINIFTTNMVLFYTAQGFTDKNYFLDLATLTNVTNEIDLFLIRENIGIEFFIDVEQNLFPLTSATISIAKFFIGEGIFKTIEIDVTDGAGRITSFLELNKDYRFTIIKDGELLGIQNKRAICEAAPCELTLSITEDTPDVYAGFSDVFASQVLYNLSFDGSTKIVTFEFVDITGLATSFKMDITRGRSNGTGTLVSSQRLFTSSGSMTFDASNESGDFTAKVFITRSPDQLIDFITFIISGVAEALGILGLFVAFLIVVTVIFGFAFSPRAFIFAIPLSLTLTKLMGIISLSNGAIVVIYLLAIVATTFISR